MFKIDHDVQNELNRIQSSNLAQISQNEPLVVSNLFKRFKKRKKEFVAVDRLSFGVESNQCFGLLGLNGRILFF